MAREEADADQGGGGAQRVGRVRGLLLPGLKRWRIRRGLTQRQLAERAGARLHYVQRVEQGKRGCNPLVAQKIADALKVSLQDLRAESDEGDSERLAPPRYLHRAYLEVLLKLEVGSAYLVLEERELEEHVEGLSVEEAVEVISRRRRELEFVEGVLASEDELHPQVRLFLEELVRERPGEDIRALAARRTRQPSGEGHERLTQAMRELL
jgi:transcriptional regulator with XRE-family HTH domain